MNVTSQSTLREWKLQLSVQEDDKDFLSLDCRGDISLPDFQPENELVARLVGPQVYSRRLLLNLERASLLDTSGISWLICCHENCQRSGGILVLHSIPPRVRFILQLLQMENLFYIAADAQAARVIALRGGT